MEQKYKLSIIIVNFNTYKYLSRCIDSIYSSSLKSDLWEVIVIDNKSSDNSVPLINKYYSQVLLIANKRNLGFAAANNKAIKQSKGRYILFLNPDTTVSKNTLSKLVEFLDSHKKVGIITPKVVLENGKLDDASHRGFPTPWNASCYFLGLSNLFPNSSFLNGYHLGYKDLDKVHEIEACVGACMMVKREAGEQVNWFDEDYFWYGEDLDFCFKVKKSGWKIVFYPYVTITHFKGISSGIKIHSQHLSVADKKTRLQAQKARFEVMRIFYKKHYWDKYPRWMTGLVMMGIKLKEFMSLLRY